MDPLLDQLQSALGSAYTLERELGGGGMSRVFVAREESLGRSVVVKVLPPEMAAAVSIERFKREIQLAARLQHPHIVPLLNAGELAGVPYFTMPFVEGESLRVRIARRGELPVSEAVRVLREIASALGYAHEHGVVHRDIKPDNVLLSGGAAMVTDFGVAKALSSASNSDHGGMTSLGVALGTPAYMAPEQASADPSVDHRADIYAFGVLAYELLTGQTPFGGRTPQGLLAAHVTEPPEPIMRRRASIPHALAALVMRCLEKRPADRPQTAGEIVHALDDLSTPSGGMAPTTAAAAMRSATSSRVRASRGRMLIVSGVVLLLAGGAALVATRNGSAVAVPASADADKSVAVLPFVNVGGDTANAYFVDGMTDEVTGALARVSGLRVASHSAASTIDTRKPVDARQAATRLNVRSLLEGRVRRSGTRMRLTMELTNAADGIVLWSQTYDRDVKDAFAVQDELAKSIAQALSVRFAGGAKTNAYGAHNAEAHDLVLRGRFLTGENTEPSLRQAVQVYERAIALDSTYADAWAGLANAWFGLADIHVPAREALVHMRPAVARAMALDSLNADVLTQAAVLAMWYDRDWDASDRTFKRALAIDSTNDLASVWYADQLTFLNRTDSAAVVIRRLARNNPRSQTLLSFGPQLLERARLVTDLEALCKRMAEVDSTQAPGCFSRVQFARGDYTASLAYCRSRSNHDCAAESLVKMGRLAEARREAALSDSVAHARGGRLYPFFMATLWAQVGDADRAMRWLDQIEQEQNADLAELPYAKIFDPIRSDPRFQAMVKRTAPRLPRS